MTREELAGHDGVPALLAYLGQPDASPAACEAGGAAHPGPGEVGQALVEALLAGKVAPGVFEPCAALLLSRLDAPGAATLAGRVLRAEAGLLADAGLGGEPAMQERLAALHRTYLGRPPGAALPAGVADGALREVRERLASAGLAPLARRTAGELAEAIELERGTWRGLPVDGDLLLGLGRQDEALLERCALRLPDAALRGQAARRLVAIRAAASPFPGVRGDPAVVETVLRLGANPVALQDHPVQAAWLEPGSLPARRVVVQQRIPEQTAILLGAAPERPEPSVLPEVSLRGALLARVAGLERPITLCRDGAFDPTPCLAAADVRPDPPLAFPGRGGVIHVVERVPEAAVVELARGASRLEIPLRVGGRAVAGLGWPVAYARPPDLVLEGKSPGAHGPDLEVVVERPGTDRLVYSVAGPGGTLQAVVPWSEAALFRVVSRGARGRAGADGSSGSDGGSGLAGASASCPSSPGGDGSPGGNGGDGESGGDGGPGGRGGDVRIRAAAPAALRAETLELLRRTVASEGGRGGPGGSGGRGGRGGRGGSGGTGTTCIDQDGHATSLNAGSQGPSGYDGRDGSSGSSGPDGRPGAVRFERDLAPGPGA
jgi:hypothetical protein